MAVEQVFCVYQPGGLGQQQLRPQGQGLVISCRRQQPPLSSELGSQPGPKNETRQAGHQVLNSKHSWRLHRLRCEESGRKERGGGRGGGKRRGCVETEERESERARERASERTRERENERARERESERARERESERARERARARERETLLRNNSSINIIASIA